LTISNGDTAIAYRLFSRCTKLLEQGIGIIFNVTQYVGNSIAMQLVHKINSAVRIDAHTGYVGITKQIVQIPQRFLVSTDQKNAQIVFFTWSHRMQCYRVGFAIWSGKFLQLAIAVAG